MNRFKPFFDKEFDLTVGLVYCGPYEGQYKAEMTTGDDGFIETFGDTPNEAVDNLYNKLEKMRTNE